MKKVMSFFVSFCVIMLVLVSCEKSTDQEPSKGELSFSVSTGKSLKSALLSDSTSGNSSDTATTGYYAIVTIVNSKGVTVYDSKPVKFYIFGSSYISESLSLSEGNYTLTKFTIVDGSKVVYACPVSGSEKAAYVDFPLPINFTISAEATTKIVPEVLAVNTEAPEQYGYASFGFEIVDPYVADSTVFYISVYSGSFESNDTVRLSAHLSIAQSVTNDSSYFQYSDFDLLPGSNFITIPKAEINNLTVTKSGFTTWSNSYTSLGLKMYESSPLIVFLSKDIIVNPTDSTLYTH